MIPQSFIQDLLNRVDIIDVVGRYVQLKKGGANFMGLCPFHNEKSPSFTVSPTKQFYHCFGCGAHGTAIGFLIEYSGLGFIDAVKDLAQNVGMIVPENDDRIAPAQRAEFQAKSLALSEAMTRACDFYRVELRNADKAKNYLIGRGLTGEIAARFGIGYAPDGWDSLRSVFSDYEDGALVEAGLVIDRSDEEGSNRKRYDRFRERIMFPIRNTKGQVIGFGGRILDSGEPKYLNSPETPLFQKGNELYGLFEARQAIREAGYVLVTEGYMDVVALAQLGFANAVATLGTACTTEHVQKLFRFTDSVVFSFDGDAAGRRAARKALDAALPFATDVRTVKFLFLPAEHDPDSFIREHGQEGFAAYVTKAVPLSKFMLEAAAEGCDLDTAEGRARMTSNAGPLWSLLPDGTFKRQLLAEIAEKVLIDARELLQAWQPAPANYKAGAKSSYKNNSNSRSPPLGYSQNLPSNTAQNQAPEGFLDYPPGLDYDNDYASSEPHFSPPAATQRKFTPQAPSSSRPVRRVAGRLLPASREDRVLRLLLTETQSWDRLSSEEHLLLSALPAPHGPLFTWLEGQLHEHGPQPWAALREGLRGHPNESHAIAQISQIPEGIEGDWTEVRRILKQLLKLSQQQEMKELATRAGSDPAALERYRELAASLKNSA